MTNQFDEAVKRVHTANTAQSVLKVLEALDSSRTNRRTRWIWELLQNAHDASPADAKTLIAAIKYSPEELIFLHNGSEFTYEQIAHLILHGSTKSEDKGTIGKFGTGFLTTHLLSWAIDVSGQLDDGQWFNFKLEREPVSVDALRESMNQAEKNFKHSLSDQKPSMPNLFTTQFVYPIKGDDAVEAVEKGIVTLKQCAPLVVVFNQVFSRIDIKSLDETISFKVVRPPLDQAGIHQITVEEIGNGNCRERKYLLAQGKKALVTVPLESNGGGSVCLPVGEIPRLFSGFPLVGTESFSFPAVINSLNFTPTEDRDGVNLGQSNNETNRTNQAVFEEACELLVSLLRFAASSGWQNTHRLAEVPAIQEKDWLNPKWLRERIKENLIGKIRQSSTVINETGNAIAPKDAKLPLAESDTSVKALWDLLDDWQEYREKLPRRDEATGWCNALKSWANLYGRDASAFNEAIDGRKLALRFEVNGCSCLENLQNLLQENVCTVTWLNQLYGFLRDNGFDDQIRNRRFVLDQAGGFHQLRDLNRDSGIDEELKDIAELLDWRIRCELRNTQLTSLDQESGAGNWDSGDVVDSLIKKLKERADYLRPDDKNSDDNFKQASARLFAWIVGQKDWDRLREFPVFAKDGNPDSLPALYRSSGAQENKTPLAPILAWPEGLKPFSNLFPPNRILADTFFEVLPDTDAWQMLNKEGLIRMDMIITRNDKVDFKNFCPEEDLPDGEHKAVEPISVTDIVERKEIMERVSDSRSRATLFWQFLTEWLIKEDVQGLESAEAKCRCGKTHKYYSAEWAMPVRNNRWIRQQEDRRARVNAQSLASLLRDSGWEPSTLKENPAAVKLLEAIDVSEFNLMREFVAKNDEERKANEEKLTEILVVTQGDLTQVHELVQHIKEDENLLQHLEDRQKKRRSVHENQRLGQQVEEWVKENLEQEGFSVRRTGIGSDFEISDLITLDIDRGDQNWLVEVKATRSQSIQMTSKQAETAVERGKEFLLCIVPIGPENIDPDLESVRANMRFIKNIGSRVAPLCEELADLEEWRDAITDDTDSGVKLVYETGTTGIRVYHSV